jgi:DNA-directed RNA polymerase subunit beta
MRKYYGKISEIIGIPNLIDVQRKSFEKFLQMNVRPEERKDIGLQGVFKSIFPIKDPNNRASLEFVSYDIGNPKYDIDECRQRGMTYAAPFKVTIRIIVWDDNEVGKSIRDVKEQEVYFGDIPLMTNKGTFIINGTERVIVSQLHRSPGVFFEHDKGKSHSVGKLLYSARIIPYRGSWLDFEFDTKDILYVRIDRRKKFPVTVLLKALGYSEQELLDYFYKKEKIVFKDDKILRSVDPDILLEKRAKEEIIDKKTGEVLIKKNRKYTKQILNKMLNAGIKYIPVGIEDILDKVIAYDVVDKNTGEVILQSNEELTIDKINRLKELDIDKIDLLFIDSINAGPYLRNTLMIDRVSSKEEAIVEIAKKLRPGEPQTIETATTIFNNLFFNPDRYDLSKVGRLKLNYRLGLNFSLDHTTLTKEDILEVVKYLIQLKNGWGEVDDIDHLGNRRVRTVGELLENQYRIGLVRMERAIKERMTLQDVETLMPHDLINSKPLTAVIREFFGSSQLSQFMDQTNPLSEITHKRRLSALGPGGLTRERAGFEVRDVNPTHYGRVCPIETPEGPNIGLIASLSTYARINEFGFIETPYREVVNGVVTDNIRFLSALDEEDHVIAQANAPVDENNRFVSDFISARIGGEFVMVKPEEVDFMDVSPKQLVSVATALIPFLEHDDANRALMGSNMQRQAVPLIKTEAPLIGTGIEKVVAEDSGVTVIAKNDGIVESVDANRIVVKRDEGGIDIYNLTKYQRSNQNTLINQKPIVLNGDRIRKGQVIADGPSISKGELALGRNVLVAFMSWGGYNFEDSILISERIVKEDYFTSIHIEEFDTVTRDTKLGKEEITRDIPNIPEESLKNLDESGIVRIGAEVKSGDILVGKVTPKGETQLSPEEKLLRAIFGEKAGEVKDTSLRVPPGIEGIVIGAKVFSRKGVEKDERTKSIEDEEILKIKNDMRDEISVIEGEAYEKIKNILLGKVLSQGIVLDEGVIIPKNEMVTEEVLLKIPKERWAELSVAEENGDVKRGINRIMKEMREQIDLIKLVFESKIDRIRRVDELPPGVIKMVKVYIAIKRKLCVGDKMAGRHGNKGVLSRIVPEEDMPYLEDGTPVDMVLNPLGVPSRMNIGQILEAHLGWAAKELGKQIEDYINNNFSPQVIKEKIKEIYSSKVMDEFLDSATDEEIIKLARSLKNGVPISTPVFDGANEEEIKEFLKLSELPLDGQTILYDGRTGEPFDKKVTVGIMYMMKLHHLVEDKIHARSVGPYSLVTQQPLGGKAQFGGQRLGEMEVWALEAYGAAHILHEFLTVKSDDVVGRTSIYEAIVKGETNYESGVPESFNVLVKELQSLALNVELLQEES